LNLCLSHSSIGRSSSRQSLGDPAADSGGQAPPLAEGSAVVGLSLAIGPGMWKDDSDSCSEAISAYRDALDELVSMYGGAEVRIALASALGCV
jgi:hypothetical protein